MARKVGHPRTVVRMREFIYLYDLMSNHPDFEIFMRHNKELFESESTTSRGGRSVYSAALLFEKLRDIHGDKMPKGLLTLTTRSAQAALRAAYSLNKFSASEVATYLPLYWLDYDLIDFKKALVDGREFLGLQEMYVKSLNSVHSQRTICAYVAPALNALVANFEKRKTVQPEDNVEKNEKEPAVQTSHVARKEFREMVAQISERNTKRVLTSNAEQSRVLADINNRQIDEINTAAADLKAMSASIARLCGKINTLQESVDKVLLLEKRLCTDWDVDVEAVLGETAKRSKR